MTLEPRVTGTICDIVRRHAANGPDMPALVAEGREPLSYGALARLMEQVRDRLNALGFGREDRIAIVGPNDPATAALFFGIWDCATAVPLNPQLSPGEFAIYLRDLKVRALAVDAEIETPARVAARKIGLPILEVEHRDGPVTGMIDIRSDAPAGMPARPGRSQPDDTALVLITSGTTSYSKIVPFSHRQFVNRLEITVDGMGLTAADRCLSLMPLYHAGGLHGALGGVFMTGGSLVLIPDFSVGGFFRRIDILAPTWYTGSSTFQRAIAAAAAAHADAIRHSRIRLIRVGADALEDDIKAALEKIFGAPVMGAYASTEVGQICIEPVPPAVRKPGTLGRPEGLEVAIMGPDNAFLGPGQRGEIVVNAANVFTGYENDPAANAQSFAGDWFRTGDEGMLDEDGYLALTGRIKDIINRGGEKITPSEVDEALQSHADVATAVTFPIPHATLGEEVAAAVVPEKGAAPTQESLTDHLRDMIAPFKVPRKFVIVGDIPKGPTGKVQRRSLAEAFGLTTPARQLPADGADDRPATPLEAKLQGVWRSVLGLNQVGLNDDFFLLGGDSLQAVELFLGIEREIGRRLPRSVLFEAGTVAKMARRIEESAPSYCLVPIQPNGKRLPFFCVHDRNGEVLNYRDLARLVGEDQPFYGIQSRGLDGEDAPFTSIEDMAAHYVREIRKVQAVGPYLLGGYSLGGHVAYVMAQQLRSAGEQVSLLALLDTYSNTGERRVGVGAWLAYHRARLKTLPMSRLPAYLWMRVVNLAGMISMSLFVRSYALAWRSFESLGRPIPRMLRRPMLANHMITRDYHPRPYDGDAILFKAERYAWSHANQHDGWRGLISGRLTVSPVPGHHYDIVKPPYVEVLAAALREAIAQAQGDPAPAAGSLNESS